MLYMEFSGNYSKRRNIAELLASYPVIELFFLD